MKHHPIIAAWLVLSSWFPSQAQQWSGSSDVNGDIYRNGYVGISTSSPNAQLVVGNRFGATISGSGGGYAVFGSNLALINAGANNNLLYTPQTHATFGYAAMRTSWGKVEFFTTPGATTAGNLVTPVARMIINPDGNVGIGGAPSINKFYVDGNILAKQTIVVSKEGSYRVAMNGISDGYIAGRNDAVETKFIIHANGPTYFNGGNVGIGTATPNEKLTVKGTVYATEVKVDLSVPGPDYVFEKDYPLPTLEEVKKYIDEHKHLPEVPSAKEMEENGVKVGEMNMILLKKVEELTLYVIEQNKLIAQLQEERTASPNVSAKQVEELMLYVIELKKENTEFRKLNAELIKDTW